VYAVVDVYPICLNSVRVPLNGEDRLITLKRETERQAATTREQVDEPDAVLFNDGPARATHYAAAAGMDKRMVVDVCRL
jgi:hypothetical protein